MARKWQERNDVPQRAFDLSWDEMAKYVVASPNSTRTTADLIERFPDRLLFGTDEVAPPDQKTYTRVFSWYQPLWSDLSVKANRKVRLTNYERIFNEARWQVRAWEKLHANVTSSTSVR